MLHLSAGAAATKPPEHECTVSRWGGARIRDAVPLGLVASEGAGVGVGVGEAGSAPGRPPPPPPGASTRDPAALVSLA